MQISLNGEDFSASEGRKLTDFLTDRGLAAERVLLEHNGVIVAPGPQRHDIVLHDGDRLFALQLVAGG